MAVKKGYKQTEVGVIPNDWYCAQVGQLATTSSGTTPSRSSYDRYFKNGSINWVKTLDLNNGIISITDEKVTAEALDETSLSVFPIDTVLVAMYGGFMQIGRTGILAIPACVNQALTAIKCNKSHLNPAYLLWVLNHRVEYWKSVASSSRKDPNITSKEIREFPLPLPPTLREQEAIAGALSDADAWIESLEQLIAKKRQIKQGAMQELLTGKRRLPGFSGKWETKRLGDIGSFLKGSGVRKNEANSGDIPCVRYGEIYTHHNDYIRRFNSSISRAVAETATRLNYGDLLFAGSGETKAEIGKCVAYSQDTEAYAGGDIVILRSSKIDPVFMGYYCNTRSIAEQKAARGQGDAVVHISSSALAGVQICVPDLHEQAAIATLLSEMDTEIESLESKLAKAREIKQGMMQELLTGRIRLV
jgi:type I restriction enzyme S subunit